MVAYVLYVFRSIPEVRNGWLAQRRLLHSQPACQTWCRRFFHATRWIFLHITATYKTHMHSYSVCYCI